MVNQTNGKLGRVFFNNFQKQNCILKPLIIIEVVYRLKGMTYVMKQCERNVCM